MVVTQEELDSELKKQNSEEWLNLSKWGTVFIISVFIPNLGLVYFWIKFKPSFDIFLSIIISYLIVTLLLLKSLLLNTNNQK